LIIFLSEEKFGNTWERDDGVLKVGSY
jgi:hypothetical protein